MKISAAALSALLVVLGASAAAAGPVADAAARAETLQAEGKTSEALTALDEAVDAVWKAGPLAFRKIVVVDKAGRGGTYTERGAGPFQPDETLTVYVEPVGYGYGGSGSAPTVGFETGLTIYNGSGQVISEIADGFKLTAELAVNRREFGMTLPFAVPYVRPGDYVAKFAMRDLNSDKTGNFEVPFTIAAPGAAKPTP